MMEAALIRLQTKVAPMWCDAKLNENTDIDAISAALQGLHSVLESGLPLIRLRFKNCLEDNHATVKSDDETTTLVTLDWLVEQCRRVQSALTPIQLARAVVVTAHLKNETQQQMELFDYLGASDEAMDVLFAITPLMNEIRDRISVEDVDSYVEGSLTSAPKRDDVLVDVDAERRRALLEEAMEAQSEAAVAKARLESLMGGDKGIGDVTHTVARSSHLEAKKQLEKAEKRATNLMKKARDAGAVLDDEASDLLALNRKDRMLGFGDGGLLHLSHEELLAMQKDLKPEGTHQFYNDKGFPMGSIREDTARLEKVIIPATILEETQLHPRLKISYAITDTELARAFAGTESLNPMQSTTFQIAFESRNNMLVCAPTGAGKTNVAMLTVAAHFRDAGVIATISEQKENYEYMEVGKKVVYIAPMKALAQEVVEKFSAKLKPLGLIVRELSGDMQLTRSEAESANVIVTTPEKWDVVTRKSGTDEKSLGNQCGLLIIDEVHLLADERGAVIESVVSRVHRLVESRQRQVRIVALSATLPNYEDVAEFLKVPKKGLFFFGPEHRPVPLQQTFIGLRFKSKDRNLKEKLLNEACYDTVIDSLRRGYQVMVFVHSRKGAGDTAQTMVDMATQEGVLESFFETAGKKDYHGEAHRRYADRAKKSRNRQVAALYLHGMGIHHAGMLRNDRKLTEQMFNDGAIKVLCCTATLAWGVNLPAHSVVIKGTEVYNPEKGGLTDLSILDVQQIFGRAGRPQFDKSGEATLITTHDAFQRYMNKLVRPIPIESNFIKQLADHLNAEVVSGTVSSLKEAVSWLQYTYLYIRMLRNPLAYGISADKKADDPMLREKCTELVIDAAKLLDANKMLRYDVESGNLGVANNGRVAAHFYIQAESIATFQQILKDNPFPSDETLFRIVCSANEFQNMRLRQEEMSELEVMLNDACPLPLYGAGKTDDGKALITSPVDKAFVLLQAYISRGKVKSFTLISDMNYIAANASRVARGIFEMCLKHEKGGSAVKLLRIAKSIENQSWWFYTPLRHFDRELNESIYATIEKNSQGYSYDSFEQALELRDMQASELGAYFKLNTDGGLKVRSFLKILPKLNLNCFAKPINGLVARFRIEISLDFTWNLRWHGYAQSFWILVEDGEQDKIHHQEHVTLAKLSGNEVKVLEFILPLFESSKNYIVRALSDSWVGVEQIESVPLQNLTIPKDYTPQTNLLNLTPLSKATLQNPQYEQLYTNFEVFNPIQTQLFHVLYNTDMPVFLGAPTGSGKTIVAELAILRMKALHPKGICVYIAPLKALARERLKEWKHRFGSGPLHWKVLELSGDTSYDQAILQSSDILVCTPEKWDLISRGWRGFSGSTSDASEKSNSGRNFVKRVRLLVLDEVHLLGEDRGAVLEAIVSRTRFISMQLQEEDDKLRTTKQVEATRIIALSTALANPRDLADWIGIDTEQGGILSLRGMYNFRPEIRPVPTKIHVQGFPGKHYCPRMATMNKPCYAGIKELSPSKPVLIFVASRRQTRLTAEAIISYAAGDENEKMFLGDTEDTYIEAVTEAIRDEALKHTLTFGIGLHHAGLSSLDRDVVEKLFLERKIQVLVATATLAWGVNLPAHLVIVKGTEYFDGKTGGYVDYPLTDVLQMIGRAGRPGFDTEAKALVLASEDKKPFYKKFLNIPFPVESCLEERLCETLNAEVAGGTIKSVVDALGYLEWTFFARRVRANPSYYGAELNADEDVGRFLLSKVQETFVKLKSALCIEMDGDENDAAIRTTTLGLACASYYLSFTTPRQMQLGVRETLKILLANLEQRVENKDLKDTTSTINFLRPSRVDEVSIAWLFYIVCSTHEFDQHPVRHNEEFLNLKLSSDLMWGPDPLRLTSGNNDRTQQNIDVFKDPHTKCFLLVQAFLEGKVLPISDYVNDTKMVIENIPRLLGAMEFIALKESSTPGLFELMTQFAKTKQVLKARCVVSADPLAQLPGIGKAVLHSRRESPTNVLRSVKSIFHLRSLPRPEAFILLNAIWKDKRLNHSVDNALDTLYTLPRVSVSGSSVSMEVDKATQKRKGSLLLNLDIEKSSRSTTYFDSSTESSSLTVLIGSMKNRILLAHDSIKLNRSGKRTVQKVLPFDWDMAVGRDGDTQIILRLLLNDVRGLDTELLIKIK